MGTTDNFKNVEFITYSTPVYSNGELVAIAGVDMDYKSVENRVANMKISETGYTVLLNEEFEFKFHENFKNENFSTIENGKYKTITDKMKRQSSGIEYYEWVNGEDKLMHYKRLINGWYVMTVIEENDALLLIKSSINEITVINIFTLVITLGLAYFIIRKMSRPLNKFEKITHDIVNGEYLGSDLQLIIEAENELSPIAENIKKMRDLIDIQLNDHIESEEYEKENVFKVENSNITLDSNKMLRRIGEMKKELENREVKTFKLEEELGRQKSLLKDMTIRVWDVEKYVPYINAHVKITDKLAYILKNEVAVDENMVNGCVMDLKNLSESGTNIINKLFSKEENINFVEEARKISKVVLEDENGKMRKKLNIIADVPYLIKCNGNAFAMLIYNLYKTSILYGKGNNSIKFEVVNSEIDGESIINIKYTDNSVQASKFDDTEELKILKNIVSGYFDGDLSYENTGRNFEMSIKLVVEKV